MKNYDYSFLKGNIPRKTMGMVSLISAYQRESNDVIKTIFRNCITPVGTKEINEMFADIPAKAIDSAIGEMVSDGLLMNISTVKNPVFVKTARN